MKNCEDTLRRFLIVEFQYIFKTRYEKGWSQIEQFSQAEFEFGKGNDGRPRLD